MNLLLAPDSVRGCLGETVHYRLLQIRRHVTLDISRALSMRARRGREKTLRFNVPTTGAISGAGITTAKRPVTHNTLSAEHRI